MRAFMMLLAVLATPHAVAGSVASEAPRFSGGGTLVAAGAASADGRYTLQADLQRGDDTQRAGRFSVQARLAASDAAKAASAACNAGPDIFRNGFE